MKKCIPKLRDTIKNNSDFRKVIANANWLFFEKSIQLAVAFFVGVWVIRYLGPERYGMLSYAVALTALFGVVAKLGMDGVAVREFVNLPQKKEQLFGTLYSLKLIAGSLAFLCSIILIFSIKGGNDLVFWLVVIISLGLIFQVSDVFDFWFQSQIKSKYSVCVRIVAGLVSASIKICLIVVKASLVAFAWAIVIEAAATFVGFSFIFFKNKERLPLPRVHIALAKKILADSWPLALAGLGVFVYMRIDQLMIGVMLGDVQLGVYSAAVSLSEIWYAVPMVISSSVFPMIVNLRKNNFNLYLERLQIFYDIMLWIAIAIAIPVTFFSKDICDD